MLKIEGLNTFNEYSGKISYVLHRTSLDSLKYRSGVKAIFQKHPLEAFQMMADLSFREAKYRQNGHEIKPITIMGANQSTLESWKANPNTEYNRFLYNAYPLMGAQIINGMYDVSKTMADAINNGMDPGKLVDHFVETSAFNIAIPMFAYVCKS